MGKKVVGIDAGYVNFAVCAIDTDNPERPYFWVNEPLFKDKFSEEKLCQEIYRWIKSDRIKKLLDGADQIILERQMTMKFQAINHCIRFLYFNKTQEINPKTFAAYFGLPQTRVEKKKASIEKVTARVVLPVKKGKKDDLCDAFLLSMCGVLQSRPELSAVWTKKIAAEPKKKKAKISE